MMVAVRVADFGGGGAAPPPEGGGAAPRMARAAGKFGGLTCLEASFMRKPAPIFRNPTRQTELIIGCRFVFGVYLRREHAQKSLPYPRVFRCFYLPRKFPSIQRDRPDPWACFVRSAPRRDLRTWRS